jgi:L-ascorbate metabolism protein UlaG (beta-lactamase superfamily)
MCPSVSQPRDAGHMSGGRLTWLGHATVLIELDGVRVLTDPVLRRRLAHLERAEAVATASLPPLDLVLVSHVHYDHLDVPSLRRLGPLAARVAVPTGAARLLWRTKVGSVVEMNEGSELELGGVRVRATHAEHRASRHPLAPVLPSLGYVVSGSRTVYFAGDTDLFDGMDAIADPLDVALVPVAAARRGADPLGHAEAGVPADAVLRRRAGRVRRARRRGRARGRGADPAHRRELRALTVSGGGDGSAASP